MRYADNDPRATEPVIPRCCACGATPHRDALAPVHLRLTARFPFLWVYRGRAPRAWWRSCLAVLRVDPTDPDAGVRYLCLACLPLARGAAYPGPASGVRSIRDDRRGDQRGTSRHPIGTRVCGRALPRLRPGHRPHRRSRRRHRRGRPAVRVYPRRATCLPRHVYGIRSHQRGGVRRGAIAPDAPRFVTRARVLAGAAPRELRGGAAACPCRTPA